MSQSDNSDVLLRLYSKDGCPSCERVKAAARAAAVRLHTIVLTDEQRPAFYAQRGFTGRDARVPKVYLVDDEKTPPSMETFIGNEARTISFLDKLPALT